MDPRHELWQRLADGTDEGVGLSWLLHGTQLEFRDALAKVVEGHITGKLVTFRCSRRLGKTRFMIVDALECGMRKKPHRWWMKYAAPTAADARNIVEEHAEGLLQTCPERLRPRWEASRSRYAFHDGSVLEIVGCDDLRKANRLRGGSLHRGYIDEGGFIPNLEFLIESVFMPMALTTKGVILMASTPSDTPAHESTRYFELAEKDGRGFHRTIYDAPHLSEAMIVEEMKRKKPELTTDEAWAFVRERSGPDDTAWIREYMAETVVDASRAICPEFRHAQKTCVVPTVRPRWFYPYVIGDVGFHDLTVMLFAYHDFERAKIVIEDEVVLEGAVSEEIDRACLQKEQQLWNGRELPDDHKGPPWEPRKRLADVDPLVLTELHRANGRSWGPCRNDDLFASVNAMRMAFKRGGIEIDPRCRTLIAHLRSGVWNQPRTSFDRVEGMGHFDALAALVYLVRHVDPNRNPMPLVLPERRNAESFVKPGIVQARKAKIRAAFGPPQRRA